jgi:hypothetical protein
MEENKNNPTETPQADNNVDAGGQADIEALKAQIAGQNAPSDATETPAPEQSPPTDKKEAATSEKLAGKFEDATALEEGYVNLEKKIGQKTDYERIGEKLHKYSGQELAQLEAELDVASSKIQSPQTTSDTPQPPDPEVAKLKTDMAVLKAQNLEQKLASEREALFQEVPEAAKYADTLSDLWKNVDTKKSLKEIYNDRFKPTEEAVKSDAQDKSKEGFTVESTVGKETGSVEDLDTSKLTVEQWREILPKHNNYYKGDKQ